MHNVMTTRRMVIVRAPGTDRNPMVRITNSFLERSGFKVGTPIEVSYQRGLITIKKLHENNNTDVSAPPAAASSIAADIQATA